MDCDGSVCAWSKSTTGRRWRGRNLEEDASGTTYLSMSKSKRQRRRLGRQGQTRACLKHPMDLREHSQHSTSALEQRWDRSCRCRAGAARCSPSTFTGDFRPPYLLRLPGPTIETARLKRAKFSTMIPKDQHAWVAANSYYNKE